MIVIAIIGILAAIALPAYAKYMARARFTEVVQAVDGVKKQVELCIFDRGIQFAANAPITLTADTSCANGQTGPGFNIRPAADYATKYVATITVNDNGMITAQAVAGMGLNSSQYIVQPFNGAVDNGIIDWSPADGVVYGNHTVAANGGTVHSCTTNDLC